MISPAAAAAAGMGVAPIILAAATCATCRRWPATIR